MTIDTGWTIDWLTCQLRNQERRIEALEGDATPPPPIGPADPPQWKPTQMPVGPPRIPACPTCDDRGTMPKPSGTASDKGRTFYPCPDCQPDVEAIDIEDNVRRAARIVRDHGHQLLAERLGAWLVRRGTP